MSTRERRILFLVIAAGVLLRALHTVTSRGSADLHAVERRRSRRSWCRQ